MTKSKNKFEFLEHTADIKFKVYGKELKEIYENAASAFSHLVLRNGNIKEVKVRKVEIKGTDYDSLLYNFLDELIFLMDKGFIVKKAKVALDGFNLIAELIGDDSKKYDLEGIKAATYAEMYIMKIHDKGKETWEAQMVLDV